MEPATVKDTAISDSTSITQPLNAQRLSQQRFICNICKQRFWHKRSLLHHKKNHVIGRRFTCLICRKSYFTKQSLTQHVDSIHNHVTFDCDVCKKKYKTKSSLRCHELIHHGGQINHCYLYSGKTLSSLSDIGAGEKEQTSTEINSIKQESPFICLNRDMTFTSKQSLETHLAVSKTCKTQQKNGNKVAIPKQEPLPCSKCDETYQHQPRNSKLHLKKPFESGETFSLEDALLEHGLSQDNLFPCKTCKRLFTSKHELLRHKRAHDEGYECEYCHKKYITLAGFRNHVYKIHLKFNKEVITFCDFCDDAFECDYELERHMEEMHGYGKKSKIYAPEKPYTCEYCNKRFRTRAHMRKHREKTHFFLKTSEQYQCEVCDDRFSCLYRLMNHRLIHSGMPVYTCEYCPLLYKTCDQLEHHMLKTHDASAYDCSSFVPV